MRATLLGRSSILSLPTLPTLSMPLAFAAAILCGACGGGAAPPPATPTNEAAPHPAGMPDHPESDKVTWKKDASPKNCHTSSKGDGDRVAAVTAMAKGCVDSAKMHMVGQA